MAEKLSRAATQNRILGFLSLADFELLEPHLTPVELPLRKQLETRNKRVEYVYFIEHGFASIVADLADRSIEVGIIGQEGVTGLPVIMATDRSPHQTFMQMAGDGQRVSVANLRRAMEESPTLCQVLLHYAYAFLIQTAYTALVNGRSKVEERLARWLLMAHDRADGDQLTLTHEFLALMLGVRRPGVTVALDGLEKRNLIAAKRGTILIIDRSGLEEAANGAYGVPEAEFARLFG
jgi:CRP-like cAMP-binding protein